MLRASSRRRDTANGGHDGLIEARREHLVLRDGHDAPPRIWSTFFDSGVPDENGVTRWVAPTPFQSVCAPTQKKLAARTPWRSAVTQTGSASIQLASSE